MTAWKAILLSSPHSLPCPFASFPMSHNMQTLLTVAAELRAAGASWEAVADSVHRKPTTCQKWPSRFRQDWNSIYHEAQRRRFEETSNEALTLIRTLMRDADHK